MAEPFFTDVTAPIRFEGLDSTEPLAFKVYDRDRLVLGKRMEDHLRPGVCFWHSFAWPGTDMFGVGHARSTVARRVRLTRWTRRGTRWRWPSSSSRSSARRTTASTTATSRPEGRHYADFRSNLDALADDAAGYQERTGVRLLWGTANLFTHPRYQAGAATNPDPEVFAYAAAQVKHMLDVTLRLGGENYVLWGGREGYDTLLNTDLRREGAQLARFLHLVAEHKHRIGFTGQLLIEPKPMEPTKHQYDYDVATVHGFLVRNGLDGEYRDEHRGQPRDAGRPQLPPRGRLCGRQRDARQHRRQPRRPAERLGHRPVPELGRGSRAADLRDPPERRHRAGRLQLRRQAAPPEHRPERPVPRPHRGAGHACARAAGGRRPVRTG